MVLRPKPRAMWWTESRGLLQDRCTKTRLAAGSRLSRGRIGNSWSVSGPDGLIAVHFGPAVSIPKIKSVADAL